MTEVKNKINIDDRTGLVGGTPGTYVNEHTNVSINIDKNENGLFHIDVIYGNTSYTPNEFSLKVKEILNTARISLHPHVDNTSNLEFINKTMNNLVVINNMVVSINRLIEYIYRSEEADVDIMEALIYTEVDNLLLL